MKISVTHKCKPEFQDEAQVEVDVDEDSVRITKEKSSVYLTHEEFKEMVQAFNAYQQANAEAQGVMKIV